MRPCEDKKTIMEEALRQVEEFLGQLPRNLEAAVSVFLFIIGFFLFLLVFGAIMSAVPFVIGKLIEFVEDFAYWVAGVLIPGVQARRRRRAERLVRQYGSSRDAQTTHAREVSYDAVPEIQISEARSPLTQRESFEAQKQKRVEEAHRWYQDMQKVLRREEAVRQEREALRRQEMESRKEEERWQREELQRHWERQQFELKRIEEERNEKAKQRSLERLREIASFERILTDGSVSRFSGEYLLSLLHWKDSWRTLEHIVGKLLNADGWETQLTSGGADGGVDVRGIRPISSSQTESLVAQVKHQRQAVNVKVVREIQGVASNENAQHALVATSGSFNREARNFRNKNRGSDLVLDLWDGKDLIQRIDNLTEEEFMEMIRGFESQLLEAARQQATQSRVEIENKTGLKLDGLIQDSLNVDLESPEAGTSKSHLGCELCGASMEHVQATRWSRSYWRCPLHKSNRRYASV